MIEQDLFIILLSSLLCFASVEETSSFDVLLVTAPFAGHANPALALGEELVSRGHNVTFSSLDNWVNLRGKAIERGMRFMSAGEHGVTEKEWNGILSKRAALKARFSKNLLAMIKESYLIQSSIPLSGVNRISEYLYGINLKQWDIIVTEEYLTNGVPCIAKSMNVSVVLLSMAYLTNESPPWPFPMHESAYSDNLSFKERGIDFCIRHFYSIIISRFYTF